MQKNNPKKIAIIGSVGIPANYGGFETLTEFLTRHISESFDTTVYCSGSHYKKPRLTIYNKARLKFVPLKANGIQSIPYDMLSILWAFPVTDVFLILGVAGSFTFPLIRIFSKKRIIVNIDGLEHKRAKWNKLARWYLKLAEKIAVKYAHEVISDNQAIADYVLETYKSSSHVIPYGGDQITREPLEPETINKYQLPQEYAFTVCRIEPENNIHLILEAFAKTGKPLVIVGNWQYSAYGRELFKNYVNKENLCLLNPIYDQPLLNQIRSNGSLYIHGHSAGGTNPSLVEAMHLKLQVVAFDVNYNRFTTDNNAYFFENTHQLVNIIENNFVSIYNKKMVDKAFVYSEEHYKWEHISRKYMALME